jgi:hypothetical protein
MIGPGTEQDACRIAALQGTSSAQIQALLSNFATRVALKGHEVAGVVELVAARPNGGCRTFSLRDLSTGAIISISQNLGPGSTACNLDTSGLAQACAAVERAIALGPDVVILSKFGKQEAERGGLADAFRAAVAAGLPVVTAVSPSVAEAWRTFAGPLSEYVLADLGSLDAWWSRTKTGTLFAPPVRVATSRRAGFWPHARQGGKGRRQWPQKLPGSK